MSLRIGIGYDIHRLEEGLKFILGGVEIPFEKGFVAHSDGDILIHAIIDSILGALGEGDIGKLFPDTDNKYKNINSMILLEEVVKIMKNKGYSIVNIDSNIITQKPKLASYIDEIRENLSNILKIDKSLISVKAKTAEKMGAVGEGLAAEAQVVSLLQKIL